MAKEILHRTEREFGIRNGVFAVLTLLGLVLFPVAVTAQQAGPGVQAVSRVTVAIGQYTACPAGFEKINIDLNQGAGGNYLWLCVEKGFGAPITGLWVTTDSGAPPAGQGYEKINVDLNRDTSTHDNSIYLWYTNDPNCSVVTGITVVVGQYTPCPTGFQQIHVDLNQGARGSFLWLCQELQ